MPIRARGGRGARCPALLAALMLVVTAALYATGAPARADGARAGVAVRAGAGSGGWTGTWYSAPVVGWGPQDGAVGVGSAGAGWAAGAVRGAGTLGVAGTARTVRNVVHTTLGGSRARVTVSNLFGNTPLDLRHATLATAADPSGTMRTLTFQGLMRLQVPAGREAVSDPLAFAVPEAADLYVTVYAAGPVTVHPQAQQTSYVTVGETDRAADPGVFPGTTGAWQYVTAVDVGGVAGGPTVDGPGPGPAAGAVVVFGDSITEGVGSTPDANHRWTDVLADRLRAAEGAGAAPRAGERPPRTGGSTPTRAGESVVRATEGVPGEATEPGPGAGEAMALGPGAGALRATEGTFRTAETAPRAVLNAGIGGNGLLSSLTGPSGLDRFERDALERPGVRTVIVELGINDLLSGEQRNAEALLSGMRELVRRGHAHGVRVLGTTLTPCGGYGPCTARVREARERVNAALRGGGIYDALVDADRTLRAPNAPQELRAAYDSGDGLHPGDAGYGALGAALNLGAL
ncbi:GDSL-type esterase/lipase family protein [Streptomyces sp. NPDC048111]|uniref:GDSL-type esterase/lipase family protein n=1 Tax=Streptomyces sp. NPDC048111 TaxID=3365500 RepID=UPI00371AA6BC